MNKKIVMLCSECFSTTVIYNAVNKQFPVERVITETPMRGMALAKRRMKKLGWFRVGGTDFIQFAHRACTEKNQCFPVETNFFQLQL